MEFVFLNSAGTTLFVRDDLESGHWVQEQFNLTADFPLDPGKVIQIGQRIAFRDPATDSLEVFEIINVTNQEPDHYQQITAENICVAELSDDHMDSVELTDITAPQAVGAVLVGTLWAPGNIVDDPGQAVSSRTQSADISRGSVWDAINTIQQNWNVYIIPRVTISSAGAITGRYLDIAPARGVWRGLRLSVRKNMVDPAVTYDETEVYTALYGYGGSVEVEQESGDDETIELTFEDEVWSATSSHPAKPAGQKYLEWPEKTALYGRNGRPRYGYYQNANIKDAGLLLQKTWESLQASCEPSISISGTCVDLYRLGYKDQPIRLHDVAIIEIEETGEQFYLEVICNDVDLIDPTGNRVEIGKYIPNIVFINRETNDQATTGTSSGGGGSGGGSGSMSNLEDENVKTWTEFYKTNDKIGMLVGTRDGDNYIKAGEIGLAINETGEPGSYESTAFIDADHVNISATQTNYSLAGELERDATGKLIIKSAGGMYVQRTESGITSQFGVWDNGNLTGGVMVQKINGQTGTVTYLKGDIVVIGNDTTIAPTYRGKTLDGTLTQITSDFTTVNTLLAQKISTNELYANIAALSIVDMVQARTSGNIVCGGGLSVGGALAVNQIYGITNSGIGTFSAVSIGGHSFDNCIVSASVSGNTLTLTPLTGSAITFSKAISSWTVGGGNGYVNVKANPQNQTKSVGISVSGSGRITSNGTYTYKAMYETSDGGVAETGATRTVEVDVSTSDRYAEGWNDCLTACGISGGGTVYTGTWYGTLYVAPTGGAQSVPNCVGQATGRQVNAM